MSITSRDKKILMVLAALLVVAGYWFLLLAPKRGEAAQAADELAEAEQRRDAAVAEVGELEGARDDFGGDYATVVRLGKAIPTSVDTPSLIVQLQRAARGTGIEFDRIATGDPATAPASAAAPTGAPAQGAPPPAGETGEESSQPESEGSAPDSEAGTTGSEAGGIPVGGGTTSAGAAPGTAGAPTGSGAPGLESVPLEFEFTGSFFHLADFFHELKRFVRVGGDGIVVRGRLMTIESLTLTSDDSFPELTAEVQATVYTTPDVEGPTAGATPEAPAGAAPPAAPSSASGTASDSSSASAEPPTGTVNP